MKAEFSHSLLAALATWWTPIFVVIFVAILAYALWPRNGVKFDAAARLPLRED